LKTNTIISGLLLAALITVGVAACTRPTVTCARGFSVSHSYPFRPSRTSTFSATRRSTYTSRSYSAPRTVINRTNVYHHDSTFSNPWFWMWASSNHHTTVVAPVSAPVVIDDRCH
jgi:hypothetical protein